MSSRFVPVTDPDKAWEYRKAGLLYWDDPGLGWMLAHADISKDLTQRQMASITYAILVEEEEDGDG